MYRRARWTALTAFGCLSAGTRGLADDLPTSEHEAQITGHEHELFELDTTSTLTFHGQTLFLMDKLQTLHGIATPKVSGIRCGLFHWADNTVGVDKFNPAQNLVKVWPNASEQGIQASHFGTGADSTIKYDSSAQTHTTAVKLLSLGSEKCEVELYEHILLAAQTWFDIASDELPSVDIASDELPSVKIASDELPSDTSTSLDESKSLGNSLHRGGELNEGHYIKQGKCALGIWGGVVQLRRKQGSSSTLLKSWDSAHTSTSPQSFNDISSVLKSWTAVARSFTADVSENQIGGVRVEEPSDGSCHIKLFSFKKYVSNSWSIDTSAIAH